MFQPASFGLKLLTRWTLTLLATKTIGNFRIDEFGFDWKHMLSLFHLNIKLCILNRQLITEQFE